MQLYSAQNKGEKEQVDVMDEKFIQYALEESFTDAKVMGTDELVFDSSFRIYCEENLCGQYDANYSCPPACGTPEEMKAKILSHKKALVLQSIWEISDYTDKEAIKKAKGAHNSAALRLTKKIRKETGDAFMIGASGCALCSPCTIVNKEPCRFPELQSSCMSAYCIFVREVTEKCGMEYDCGKGLLGFFGMVIFD